MLYVLILYLFSQLWLPTVQDVLHADWQDVWHSPHPPFFMVSFRFLVFKVLICFIFSASLTLLNFKLLWHEHHSWSSAHIIKLPPTYKQAWNLLTTLYYTMNFVHSHQLRSQAYKQAWNLLTTLYYIICIFIRKVFFVHICGS